MGMPVVGPLVRRKLLNDNQVHELRALASQIQDPTPMIYFPMARLDADRQAWHKASVLRSPTKKNRRYCCCCASYAAHLQARRQCTAVSVRCGSSHLYISMLTRALLMTRSSVVRPDQDRVEAFRLVGGGGLLTYCKPYVENVAQRIRPPPSPPPVVPCRNAYIYTST